MAPSSSDTDSPKSSSSSSSSRTSDEDEDRRKTRSPIAGAGASSDESTTSDGVLVEIPGNQDHVAIETQEQENEDGDILVNIDGSMQEGREDLFVDASEELGSARSVGMVESLSNEDGILKLKERVDEADAQCRKYKEEREVFGREVSNLRFQLQEMLAQQLVTGTRNEESVEFLHQIRRDLDDDETFMSPTPLHAMVNDCSNILSHFSIVDQSNSEDTINRLNAIIYAKEQEIENLKLKTQASNRLLASIETVIGTENSSSEYCTGDEISPLEKKTMSLVEKHTHLLSETQQLRQLLAETRPELLNSKESEFSSVYSTVRDELYESKRKEALLLEKINELENENRRIAEMANAETNKLKTELEQSENKLATAREKLSIAVTKGKSLVQHRDALKQSLAEKTSELEKCMHELQEKSSALEASESRIEELKRISDEKSNELANCLLELQHKSTALETTETSTSGLNQSLIEKTYKLENCMLELQERSSALQASKANTEELKQILAEKTNELENCLLELQQKSTALETSENSVSILNQSVVEKSSELEKYIIELQEKSSALEALEVSTEKLKQLLSAKTCELEKCLIELQNKSTALVATENGVSEINKSLFEKTSELEKCMLELKDKSYAHEILEANNEELKQQLSDKTIELKNCLLKSQEKPIASENTEARIAELDQSLYEKTSELEKCLLDLQEKTQTLENAESSAEVLKQSLAEKIDELNNCLLELRQKSDALDFIETNFGESKQLLSEKNGELEKCFLELQSKSDTLIATENSIKELRNTLTGKISKLEKCQLELEEKSDILVTARATAEDLTSSLQFSLSERDRILKEIENVTQHVDSNDDFHAMEVVDRVKWFVSLKHKLDTARLEINQVKNVLSPIDIPESILTCELYSQVEWLVKSFIQANENIIKLKASHELNLSEAHKEKDHLTASLAEVKQEKDYLQGVHDDIKRKFEKIADHLSLDNQLDTEMLVEKCLSTITKRMNVSLMERKKYEEIQTLLYVKYQEQILCESLLEEDTNSISEMKTLSNELRKASEEVVILRKEKEALQKELERVEDKSSLIREKLSMAVKKGKGLVQEREGYKHSLDEKNSEIKKLKEELQIQESAIVEYKERLEILSSYPEQIQKLESDFAKLAKVIQDIIVPTDKIFEDSIEKLHWIAEYIRESENNTACLQQELEEAKFEAGRLSNAFETIETLKQKLSMAEENIYNISQEKKEMEISKVDIVKELKKLKEMNLMQVSKLEDADATIRSLEDQISKMNIEDKFKKLKEESYMNARKLEDSFETIKSLQDAIAQSSESISNLEAEKIEIKFNSQQQLDALNAKLVGQLESLWIIMNDESLFSLMTEEFRKKIVVLRDMGNLIQDLHDQFISKGLHIHTDLEASDFAKVSSLKKFEDFIIDEGFNKNISIEEFHGITALSKYVEGLRHQFKLLRNCFQSLSQYTDDHIEIMSHDLMATHDEFIHILKLYESVNQNIGKLESENQAYEAKISSLTKEIKDLHSTCQEVIRELQIQANNLSEFNIEQDIISSNLGSENVEEGEGGMFAIAAESLSLATQRIKIQSHQLLSVNRVLATSVDDLKNELQKAEITADNAIKDRQSSEQRVLKLERELEELQDICSEMNVKLEDSHVKENMLREKEEEIASMQISLAAKGRGTSENLFQEGQVEELIEKVNNVVISKFQFQDVDFSNPVAKLFYILDSFTELQDQVDSLTNEKEDMKLILDSHISEIEQRKIDADNISKIYQDLEAKKLDLIELTVGLEKIIKRFGGNNISEDQNPFTIKGFLTVLERMIVTSNNELDISLSRVQELSAKLQASEKYVDELSTKNKLLDDSIQARVAQPDIIMERSLFDASKSATGSEISEIEDVGALGKNTISPAAAHVRTMRKGSSDHLVLNIDSDTDRLISAHETDDKGHVFKSLNASGLIPKQGKLIADRMDGIWVSGGRILMNRPRARLGLIAYWIFIHLWLLGTIL